ncbi:BTAD domain-containing putative transcriptional regulator [Streptomyces sp. S1]|uniref:AfsR/SARP family transcriptional regulator n=1 Tax=unclassified Streptomyces TaxID=2593676 RepID=UPI001F08A4D7|nr:BTAD domain-containing putative transcriptional regulator [Streptomyces sp. S1]
METTLATLLIGSGRVITKEQLVTELWGDRPPRRASAAVHVYISQLRKFLAVSGAPEGRAIVTRPLGYELRLDGAGWDVEEFKEAMRLGRELRAAGRHEEALECFERVLGLFRGPVLDGIAEGPVLTSFATWAEEERLQSLELSVEARSASDSRGSPVARSRARWRVRVPMKASTHCCQSRSMPKRAASASVSTGEPGRAVPADSTRTVRSRSTT